MRDGSTYEPYWDSWAAQEDAWLAEDQVAGAADVRVLNRADGNAPDHVLQALKYLPALTAVLAPELSDRRGLQLRAERLEATPDAPTLFESLYGTSSNAVWLDSSNAAAVMGSAQAEERSRFSIMADDGGTYGQVATHRSGSTGVTVGTATATIPGPFFRWLDSAWGRRAVRAPQGYECQFTLGWLGFLGYELKRETGGSDVQATTPDAALLFAGRAVVLDHHQQAVWLLALEAPDADAWLQEARTAVGTAVDPGHAARQPLPGPGFTSRDSATDYKRKIAESQHQISLGNSYEVCLTTMLQAPPADWTLGHLPETSTPEPGSVRQLSAIRPLGCRKHLAGTVPQNSVRRRYARRAHQGHPPPGC